LHYQDYSNGNLTPSHNVYLFNRVPNVLPKYGKTVGGGQRGIACIALSFINANDMDDDDDDVIPLTEEELSGDDFKNLVAVTLLPENDPTPSADALVLQFNVWEQGRIDGSSLKERLSTFVSHALWDVVTEVHLLSRQLTVATSSETPSAQLSTLFSNFSTRFV
jgi:hypothetical protein